MNLACAFAGLFVAVTFPALANAAEPLFPPNGTDQPNQLVRSSAPACTDPPERDGATVAAKYLGGLEFLGPQLGLAVTSPWRNCPTPSGPGHGGEVTVQESALHLASTSDGGRRWNVVGHALPPASSWTSPPIELAFVSRQRGWALDGGLLVGTTDGGKHWHTVALGRDVLSLARTGQSVVALASTCPAGAFERACPLSLWTASPGRWQWRDSPALPVDDVNAGILFASGPSAGDALVALENETGAPLLATTDGGRHWIRLIDPCTAPAWEQPATVAVAPSGQRFILCLGSAAAGSSTKALYAESPGGGSWTQQSALNSLDAPFSPDGLPGSEPGVLAAPSSAGLWLSTTNGVSGSNDSGTRWSLPSGMALEGSGQFGVFDFLRPDLGWFLAAGSGVWRTTDGVTWRRL